jgi:hypothetical protein
VAYGDCELGSLDAANLVYPVHRVQNLETLWGEHMRALIDYIKKLFARVPPAVTDEHCPYCRGLGYDSSGWTCTCLREKK